ncbi:MAG: GxxExxY protein [Chitinophagaceae bacterium]|nr:MAG: GxxExxY protein [Chitinophagaceae bacterium]
MNENELATIALDICFEIHRRYGPGLFESVYEEIFCYELGKTGIPFKRQHAIPVVHESIKMEIGFRADVILDDKVIVEIKSVESLADVHLKQVSTYLRLTKLKLGLLVNFNTTNILDCLIVMECSENDLQFGRVHNKIKKCLTYIHYITPVVIATSQRQVLHFSKASQASILRSYCVYIRT